ncbi:MAG: hypothetical protein NVSMB51_01360 [Solirubrobacteraceae bacterium]
MELSRSRGLKLVRRMGAAGALAIPVLAAAGVSTSSADLPSPTISVSGAIGKGQPGPYLSRSFPITITWAVSCPATTQLAYLLVEAAATPGGLQTNFAELQLGEDPSSFAPPPGSGPPVSTGSHVFMVPSARGVVPSVHAICLAGQPLAVTGDPPTTSSGDGHGPALYTPPSIGPRGFAAPGSAPFPRMRYRSAVAVGRPLTVSLATQCITNSNPVGTAAGESCDVHAQGAGINLTRKQNAAEARDSTVQLHVTPTRVGTLMIWAYSEPEHVRSWDTIMLRVVPARQASLRGRSHGLPMLPFTASP